MISNHPAVPQASSPADVNDGAAGISTPVMNPRKPIEVASGGNGTVNDPPGADIKPPFSGDYEIPA